MRSPSPNLFKNACLAICAVLIAGDIAFALYARASQTDYGGSQSESMKSLPYPIRPTSVENWSADIDGMDLPSQIARTRNADVIIRATLEDDDKDIGYKAVLASVRVLEVYRGDCIDPGDHVTIIEPYEINELSQREIQIMQDETPNDLDALLDMTGLSSGDKIHIMQPNGEPYLSGALPLSKKNEYLLFLDIADSHLARRADVAAATYVQTPFSCLSLLPDASSEIPKRTRYAPINDLNDITFLAADSETLDKYRQITADMLAYAEELGD